MAHLIQNKIFHGYLSNSSLRKLKNNPFWREKIDWIDSIDIVNAKDNKSATVEWWEDAKMTHHQEWDWLWTNFRLFDTPGISGVARLLLTGMVE